MPRSISPGGRIRYIRPEKYPQLPSPAVLKIDYPYIIIDNWFFRIFPLTDVEMRWISESTAAWVRKRRGDREYKMQIIQFIDDLERVSRRMI